MVSYHTAIGMYQKPPSTTSAHHQHYQNPHHHQAIPPASWYHHHHNTNSYHNAQFGNQTQYLPNCLHEPSLTAGNEPNFAAWQPMFSHQNASHLYHHSPEFLPFGNTGIDQNQGQNLKLAQFGDQNSAEISSQIGQNSAGVLNLGAQIPSPPITVSGGSEISSPGAIPDSDLGDRGGQGAVNGTPGGANSAQRLVRSPYEWMKKPSYQSQPNPVDLAPAPSLLDFAPLDAGKTRTKDKYRVVYTDHQRIELEKEFQYARYIDIRRKSKVAQMLQLSERQVKIWFQNRRAKERKVKKRDLASTGDRLNHQLPGTHTKIEDQTPVHNGVPSYLHQQLALHGHYGNITGNFGGYGCFGPGQLPVSPGNSPIAMVTSSHGNMNGGMSFNLGGGSQEQSPNPGMGSSLGSSDLGQDGPETPMMKTEPNLME